jgi:hypothetical protein
MDEQRKLQLAEDLNDLGRHFWAGEAEICRAFWGQPRTAEEQAHWLRLQVFKEMYGSGLSASPEGLIRGYLDELREKLERVESRADRDEYERELQFVREEFSHFRLFADVLEAATGEPVKLAELKGWQLSEDRKLQELRQSYRDSRGAIGALAVAFTEGGGSSFFFEGRQIGGDPVSDHIASACEVVFRDELEHGEHGASEVERELDSDEDWAAVREMVIEICKQRLRMRYQMFALPIDESRIQEIAEGKIETLIMTA